MDFGTLSIFGPKNKSKEHLSLAEITAVCRLGGDKTLGIFTSARSQTLTPIQLRFSGDIELEGWQAHLVAGVNSVRRCTGGPTPGKCVFSVASRGEVCLFDAQAAENESGGGKGSGDRQVWSLTQFYSVEFSQSRIGVNKCVFYKRTIKVCVSCC